MNDASINQWKQANEVYKELLDLTVGEAISELHGMQDLSDEVKSLVLVLVSSGSQSSQFFKQQIGSSFQSPEWQQSMYAVGDDLGDERAHGGLSAHPPQRVLLGRLRRRVR